MLYRCLGAKLGCWMGCSNGRHSGQSYAGGHPGSGCHYTRICAFFDKKARGAAEDCRRQGIAFLPLAVESFGGWHSAVLGEVKKLGAALARQTGQEEGEAVGHLWGRLGILLQRGNAAILAPSAALSTQHFQRLF